jgi:hypothetical protein
VKSPDCNASNHQGAAENGNGPQGYPGKGNDKPDNKNNSTDDAFKVHGFDSY